MKLSKRLKAEKKRIVIVDDHPMMRGGLAQLVAQESDLEVCGEAGDVHDALAKIKATKPHLVLTDISLPGKNGLELIKDITAMQLGAMVLVISMHDETLYADRVLKAGARGYIMKQKGGEKIIAAIRRVLDGQIYLSENMSTHLLETLSGKRTSADSPISELSDREFEIFQMMGDGVSAQQIADHLHLSVKTVDAHRANIKGKLKLRTTSELVAFAARWSASEGGGQYRKGRRQRG